MAGLLPETERHLHNQLVKLGDMMGDDLHLEPGGAWITKDYRRTAKALGYDVGPNRANNRDAINAQMIKRVADVSCGKCGGQLKQTRSGSKRAVCVSCQIKWILLK